MTTDGQVSSQPPPHGPIDDRADRVFPVGARRLGAEGLLVLAVAWAWAALSFRVWDLSPRVPLIGDEDGWLTANLVKSTADQGWWSTNPDLGFPVGQQLYDLPHNGETWQLGIIRLMSLFTTSPGVLVNAYLLLGIGLGALASYLALRHLRIGVGAALVASAALTWLPLRVGEGGADLFRVALWWVPLSLVVILWVLHWRERFLIDPEPPARPGRVHDLRWNLRHNLRRRRILLFATMLVVLAGSEIATTATTIALLVLLGVVAAVRRRDLATFAVHALAASSIGAAAAVLFLPTSRFLAAHGTNDAVTALPDGFGVGIGLLGAAGFVGAVGHSVTRGWGARRRELRPPHDRDGLRDDLGLLVVVATLIATASGIALVEGDRAGQGGAWDRVPPIIAFASLAYAATWMERGWDAVRTRITGGPGRDRAWLPSVAGVTLVVVLVGFVLWDGAPVPGPDPATRAAGWAGDEGFVRRIDEATPDGTAVFQLPVVAFPPDPASGPTTDPDPLQAFLHTPAGHLRWSHGGLRGRPEGDWQLAVPEQLGEAGSLPALIGAGFTGVWVDTSAYPDDGAEVTDEMDDAIGEAPLISDDGRVRFYDLRALRDRLVDAGTSMDDLRGLAREQLGLDLP